jgi:hypothetical protein
MPIYPSFIETAGIKFVEITAEKYDDMLNILPPILWAGGAFMVSEPNDHRKCRAKPDEWMYPTYHGYWQLDGKHYAADTDLTVAEFKAITGHDMRIAIATAARKKEG